MTIDGLILCMAFLDCLEAAHERQRQADFYPTYRPLALDMVEQASTMLPDVTDVIPDSSFLLVAAEVMGAIRREDTAEAWPGLLYLHAVLYTREVSAGFKDITFASRALHAKVGRYVK